MPDDGVAARIVYPRAASLMPARTALPRVDPIDAMLIQRLQSGFPISEHPYREVGEQLGLSEHVVITRLQHMLDDGMLTRFGPVFQSGHADSQFVLAAMQVPPDRFEQVAAQVNALDAVVRNTRREHAFNMWFVVAGASLDAVAVARNSIEHATGLRVYAFPKEKEFFLELRLPP